MNRASPELLRRPNAGMTIIDRKRPQAAVNRQQHGYFNPTELSCLCSVPNQEQSGWFQGLMGGGNSAATRPVKPDSGLETGWPELSSFEIPSSGGFGLGSNYAISRTASCPPATSAAASPPEKIFPAVATDNSKKRKAQITKVAEEDIKEKKVKGYSEDGESLSKITNDQTSNSEVQTQKLDYIHVRARRGQATDSHSLAERVRREKISERMKYLQDLVPGCNKITGKAGMLDEIINYVESLQRQVEFLSMKLAIMDPRTDFNTDHVCPKEMFPSAAANFQTSGMSLEMGNQAYLQFSSVQQVCGLVTGMSSSEMAIRRTISAPLSLPDPFMDSSCFTTQMQPSTNWNSDLQNMYNIECHRGRPTSVEPHQFTGSMDAIDL